MADRIGVIAGGRLIAEGTLDELRGQAGKSRDQPRGHVPRAGRRRGRRQREPRPARSPGSRARVAPRLARLAVDDDGRAALARAHRSRSRSSSSLAVMHLLACRMVGALRRRRRRSRQGDAGRDHRQRAALLVADAVAGDGIGDARVLCALRPRPHPLLAGRRAQRSSRCASPRWRSRSIAMAALLAAPFINVLAARGGARWLGAYGVVVAMGATAAALAVALTVALFRLIGPKRTRLVAQIVAAVIGAVFVIGLQVAAILSYGTLSRIAFLRIGHARRAGARRRQPRLVAGARHARRRRPRSPPCSARASSCSAPRSWCSRRASASTRSRPPASRATGARQARRARAFRRASPTRRCAARNGRCCGAIPGWCRRR